MILSYLKNHRLRQLAAFSTFVSELMLALYLIYLPMNIAFYPSYNQNRIDIVEEEFNITALALFSWHIVLYLYHRLNEIVTDITIGRSWSQVVLKFEFAYDILAFWLSFYLVVSEKNSYFIRQVIHTLFLGKFYKLAVYSRYCHHHLQSTGLFILYKIVMTILTVLNAISIVGSAFYGLAFFLYNNNYTYTYLLWIVDIPAVTDLVGQNFYNQVLYTMYWALATGAGAAYGDISGVDPVTAAANITVMLFVTFLFGYYMSTMHSIPAGRRQKQKDIIDSFRLIRQYNQRIQAKRTPDIDAFYFRIVCSIQFEKIQKLSAESLQVALPADLYAKVCMELSNPFLSIISRTLGCSDGVKSMALVIKETVCGENENLLEFSGINLQTLVYLSQGTVSTRISGEVGGYFSTESQVNQFVFQSGYLLNLYNFLMGRSFPIEIISTRPCIILHIDRNEIWLHCSYKEKLQLMRLRGQLQQGDQQNIIFKKEPTHSFHLYQQCFSTATASSKARISLRALRKDNSLHRSAFVRKRLSTHLQILSLPKTRNIKTQTWVESQTEFEIIYGPFKPFLADSQSYSESTKSKLPQIFERQI